jgi:hypothetical protein
VHTLKVVAVASMLLAAPFAWMASAGAQGVMVVPVSPGEPVVEYTTVRSIAASPEMQVTGPVSKVDLIDNRIVLADAVDLRVPPSVPVALADVREGTPVTARYENVGGERIVTSLHVEGDAVQAP